jgi:hypothetical protein
MIEVTVTSVLQLPAGKMIFCKWPEGIASGEAEPRAPRPQDRRDPRNGRDYRGEPRREGDRSGERPAAEAPRHPESAEDGGADAVAPASPGTGPRAD